VADVPRAEMLMTTAMPALMPTVVPMPNGMGLASASVGAGSFGRDLKGAVRAGDVSFDACAPDQAKKENRNDGKEDPGADSSVRVLCRLVHLSPPLAVPTRQP
jgi:hypothetical protein